MDYVSLNVTWVIANGVLAVLYKTILSEMLGNKILFELGKSSNEFLRKLDKTDARQLLALLIFIIFTLITIKMYGSEREKNPLGMIVTIILGAIQLWVMWVLQF